MKIFLQDIILEKEETNKQNTYFGTTLPGFSNAIYLNYIFAFDYNNYDKIKEIVESSEYIVTTFIYTYFSSFSGLYPTLKIKMIFNDDLHPYQNYYLALYKNIATNLNVCILNCKHENKEIREISNFFLKTIHKINEL